MISASFGVLPALIANIRKNENFSSDDDFNKTYAYYDANFTNHTESKQCWIDPDSRMIKPFKYSYDFIYLASVIIITSLYILIYKEIYTRRKTKRDRKQKLLFNSYLNSGGTMLNKGKGETTDSCFQGNSCFSRIFCMKCKEKQIKEGNKCQF